MPDSQSYDTRYVSWKDPTRDRLVAAKLYLPLGATPAPLVVFSHGLGGSREGYSYMGKYWASQGYASLHLPMDGTLTRAAIDVSGRPFLVWKVNFTAAISENMTCLNWPST